MTTTPKTYRPKATDSVIAEVRRVKDELAKCFNYDVAAIARDALSRQASYGHEIVNRSTGA